MLPVIAAALFGLCTLAMSCGCSPRRATLTPLAAAPPAEPKTAANVEVLLDRAPEGPFTIVGQLEARAIESPKSIEMMREEAARAGYDGIYWIECATPGSGRCTAKGYVYGAPADPTDAPAIAAK